MIAYLGNDGEILRSSIRKQPDLDNLERKEVFGIITTKTFTNAYPIFDLKTYFKSGILIPVDRAFKWPFSWKQGPSIIGL